MNGQMKRMSDEIALTASPPKRSIRFKDKHLLTRSFHHAAAPPSTLYTQPVVNDASSLNRNAMVFATSEASPFLCRGRLEYVLVVVLEVADGADLSRLSSIGV